MRVLTACLVTLVMGAGTLQAQEQSDAEQRMEALNQMYMKIVNEWQKERQKAAEEAQKSGGSIPATRMEPPNLEPVMEEALAAAEDFAGEPEAVQFLLYVMQRGGPNSEKTPEAVEILIDDHAASPEIAQLGAMFQYLPRMVGEELAGELMAAIEEHNEDGNVLAWVTVGKHGDAIENAAIDSAEYKAARAAMLAAMAQATDKALKAQIQGKIDGREKFGMGATAPDIEGMDLDGVDFKLSDYEGKVVFLDFWGDW